MASIGPASPETAARFRKRAAAQHDNKISAAAVARLKEEITEEKLLQRVEDRKAEREKASLQQDREKLEQTVGQLREQLLSGAAAGGAAGGVGGVATAAQLAAIAHQNEQMRAGNLLLA